MIVKKRGSQSNLVDLRYLSGFRRPNSVPDFNFAFSSVTELIKDLILQILQIFHFK